jgi:catechol 2,3-dioxygenase-like lactoylglutathione lyase family enzyme
MPTLGRLSHVVIHVNDIEKMVAFYRDVMGMKITHEGGGRAGKMVFLTSDPAYEDHEIGLFSGRNGDANSNVLNHYCWRVPTIEDVRAFYKRFVELGVPIDDCVSYAYPWGEEATISCYFRDPEGNGLELQAFVELDPNIPDRSVVPLDFTKGVEEIAALAQRRDPAVARR